MSLYIDKKFVALISNRLERFHAKSEFLWNMRCPVCGDSQKNKFKCRGYIYRRPNGLFYTCHNCNASLSLGSLIKLIDPVLYREYLMEKYKDASPNTAEPDFSGMQSRDTMMTRFAEKQAEINLPTIASLPEDHAAKLFLLNRKIPRAFLSDMYYTTDFAEFIKELIPDYEKKLYPQEKRIVIPFRDENKNLLGVQGRALVNDGIRYISVKLKDSYRKIFGLDRIDFKRPVRVVEGPLDSLFLDNTLATMDSSLYNIIPMLGDNDYVFLPDNEPRNRDIVRVVKKIVEMNRKVVIWPSDVEEKDINDMIKAGRSSMELERIIERCTYEGLRAKLELDQWKKI